MIEILMYIKNDDPLFVLFRKVIKKANYPTKELIVKTIDAKRSVILHKSIYIYFKFKFDWQSEDICSIEMIKLDDKNE
jgi:hypothetical protein